jgi:hypothetical protein
LRDAQALEQVPAPLTGRLALEVRSWTGALTAVGERVRAAATSPPAPAGARMGPPCSASRTPPNCWPNCKRSGRSSASRWIIPVARWPGAAGLAPLAWRRWHFAPEVLPGVRQAGGPCDNNAAERGIRPLVIVRKISGGTRSPRGSQTPMRLYTLFATWTAKGLDPLAQCQHLLQSPLPQV